MLRCGTVDSASGVVELGESQYPCSVCGKQWSTRKGMSVHAAKAHGLQCAGRIAAKCVQCGGSFTAPAAAMKKGRGRFCSRECYDTWWFRGRRAGVSEEGGFRCDVCGHVLMSAYSLVVHKRHAGHAPTSLLCETCGRRFTTAAALRGHSDCPRGEQGWKAEYECTWCTACFASQRALAIHTAKLHGETIAERFEVVCAHCGKQWLTWKAMAKRRRRHFCSRKCLGAWNSEHRRGRQNPQWHRQEMPCEACGKTMWVIPARLGRTRTCSHACHNALLQRECLATGGPNWKGGVTPQKVLWCNSAEGKRWRVACKRAAGYKCALCGREHDVHSGSAAVHHVFPWATHPVLRAAVTNGRVVCLRCADSRGHYWLHSKAGASIQVRWQQDVVRALGRGGDGG